MSWVIAGKPDTAAPEVAKEYVVRHTRKGTFRLRVTAVNDTWLTGVITSGKAHAALAYNEREEGEEITVRDTLCHLSECGPEAT